MLTAERPALGVVTFLGSGSGIVGSSLVIKGIGPAAVRSNCIAGSGPTDVGSTIVVGIVRPAIL
jgi:hypothetical protein